MDSRSYTSAYFHTYFLKLSRAHKKLVMVLADLIALPLALWSGYALRFADWWPVERMGPFWWFFIVMPPVGIFIFARLGLYRAVVRFMGPQAILAVVKGASLLAVLMWASAYFYQLNGFPRSVPVNFALVTLIYVGGTRLLVRSYYHWLVRHFTDKDSVLIYGAGGTGIQLSSALTNSVEYYVSAFLDDDSSLAGSTVRGLKVYLPNALPQLIEKHQVKLVLLAMPSASSLQRKAILDRLDSLPVHVKTVPAMAEIISGDAEIDQLQDIALEDLLGRDPVPPKQTLFSRCIENKVVMVTGAGGSIGSELCRQIISAKPKSLILYEQSEYALYAIEKELSSVAKEHVDFEIIPVLGSVCNEPRFRKLIKGYAVQTIYHAAAYKHVPIVEHNLFEGIRNNIFGTRTVARAAAACGVQYCILISTDKAVRPTNVMGATKRVAELVLQDLSTHGTGTIFSMVRFGNVLGSSGSVVPLFRKQIEVGGPVTVTHPEITRYFMTIPEAAQLVIQAGAMAAGGDVFVLDMGDPVKISELARRMIQLSGLEVKSEFNPNGDIEIAYTGLRSGEKLYEELLIGGDNVIGTEHPKIMRAQEEKLSSEELEAYLDGLELAAVDGDCERARALLEQAVRGFMPSSPMVDLIHAKYPYQSGDVLKLR